MLVTKFKIKYNILINIILIMKGIAHFAFKVGAVSRFKNFMFYHSKEI
jgi:hypothetical protein